MIESLPPEIQARLTKYHFDREQFEAQRARLAAAYPDLESLHRIVEPVAPPPTTAVAPSIDPASAEGIALAREGEAAIARGELGVVILAGGMATRFGSTVKALAPLFDRKPAVRFIDVKLADVARAAKSGSIDTTIMTSFATDDAIRAALAGTDVHYAPQFVSLRLTEKGELFREPNGAVSLYATGHGDLPDALQRSQTIARLKSRGVKTVLMSNVDNLGATIDPILFAQHRRLGRKITVELVSKIKGDKGGMPVERGGSLVLAEAFRLPPDFPHDSFPLFNTNTLWFDVDALEGDFAWTWCVARKKVEGLEAVQLERLVGELTWWRSTSYVHVSREGVSSRFIPIKDIAELERSRPTLELVMRERIGMKQI